MVSCAKVGLIFGVATPNKTLSRVLGGNFGHFWRRSGLDNKQAETARNCGIGIAERLMAETRGDMRKDQRDDYLSIAVVIILSLAPVAIFLVLTYLHSIEAAKASLSRVAALAVHDADRLIEDGERILTRLSRDTDLKPTTETIKQLSRAEYIDPRFREIGIIDEQGFLVATNFGPVIPPVPIPSELRSDPRDRRLQLLGAFETVLMGEKSIVLAMPTRGEGEVNLLVDPAILIDELSVMRIDPEGYVVFLDAHERVLAKIGPAPVENDSLVPDAASDALRVVRKSNLGLITVVAEAPGISVLREWWGQLVFAGPIAIVCNLAVAVLLLRGYRRHRGIDSELRIGLRRGEFEAHYQPILELASGRCVAVEALLRWRHPRHGVVRPDIFIPVAERTGILPEISDWLLSRIAEEMRRLEGASGTLTVGVNVAPSQLIGGTGSRLATKIADGPFPADRLILEITENSLIEGQAPGYQSAIAQLRGHGAEFALDDFGVGFSSLDSIVALDVKYLKIDKSFVHAIGRDERRVLVLGGLIELAHKLGLDVIAEGIERDEERAYLLALGVRYGQGWLFSPALPAHDLRRYLTTMTVSPMQCAPPGLGALGA
jgi:c-di-GMP phosphodiesterase